MSRQNQGDQNSRAALYFCGNFHTFSIKGIVHFEINCWYILAYLKGIQDVGVFVFFSHIMEVYGHHLKEHAQ